MRGKPLQKRSGRRTASSSAYADHLRRQRQIRVRNRRRKARRHSGRYDAENERRHARLRLPGRRHPLRHLYPDAAGVCIKLIPPEQISRVDFVFYIIETGIIAVGDDAVANLLKLVSTVISPLSFICFISSSRYSLIFFKTYSIKIISY